MTLSFLKPRCTNRLFQCHRILKRNHNPFLSWRSFPWLLFVWAECYQSFLSQLDNQRAWKCTFHFCSPPHVSCTPVPIQPGHCFADDTPCADGNFVSQVPNDGSTIPLPLHIGHLTFILLPPENIAAQSVSSTAPLGIGLSWRYTQLHNCHLWNNTCTSSICISLSYIVIR